MQRKQREDYGMNSKEQSEETSCGLRVAGCELRYSELRVMIEKKKKYTRNDDEHNGENDKYTPCRSRFDTVYKTYRG